MTWLTWRQHRHEALLLLGVALAIGAGVVALTVTGSAALAQIGRVCSASPLSQACLNLTAQFQSHFPWGLVLVAGTIFPVLVGAFVGAPLVAREVESGRHVVAWSQGVTRSRWFWSRVLVASLGAAVVAGVVAGAAAGWFVMQSRLASSAEPINLNVWGGFEIGPPVLIAYTLFAAALGTAAGAALRRVTPAAALTLAGYIAVRVAIALGARTRYVGALAARSVLSATPPPNSGTPGAPAPPPGGWSVGSASAVDATARIVPNGNWCASPPPVHAGCYQLPITWSVPYQPESRFWLFQGIEAAIFVLLALGLFVLAHRLVMRTR